MSALFAISLEQRGASFGLFEVKDDGLFASIQPDKIAALSENGIVIAPGEIAFRTLDLDDFRAGVGKARGAKGRRDRLLDGDDGKACQRLTGARQ